MLTREEEQSLARRIQQGDERACDALLQAHLRLVFSMAAEFGSYGLAFDDLVSEALVGLLVAVRRFDPDRGVRFAAYAAWWIRAQLRQYTLANRRIVRSPSTRNGRMLLARLRRTQRLLGQHTGEQPDRQAVANALGVAVSEVEEIECVLSSRDMPCGVEIAGRTLEIASEAPSPEALVAEADEQRDMRRDFRRALTALSQRERRIIEERCLREVPSSLADLGRDLGISRERVRQLEVHSQKKLSSILQARKAVNRSTEPLAQCRASRLDRSASAGA